MKAKSSPVPDLTPACSGAPAPPASGGDAQSNSRSDSAFMVRHLTRQRLRHAAAGHAAPPVVGSGRSAQVCYSPRHGPSLLARVVCPLQRLVGLCPGPGFLQSGGENTVPWDGSDFPCSWARVDTSASLGRRGLRGGGIARGRAVRPARPENPRRRETAGPKAVRLSPNTHFHSDHTGGTHPLGTDGAVIVAQDNVFKRLGTEQYSARLKKNIPPAPAAALPVVSFADSLTFHFDGEQVDVFHVVPAHTDGDSASSGSAKPTWCTWATSSSTACTLSSTAARRRSIDDMVTALDAVLPASTTRRSHPWTWAWWAPADLERFRDMSGHRPRPHPEGHSDGKIAIPRPVTAKPYSRVRRRLGEWLLQTR